MIFPHSAKKRHRQKNIEPTVLTTTMVYACFLVISSNCAVEESYNLYNYERHLGKWYIFTVQKIQATNRRLITWDRKMSSKLSTGKQRKEF